MDSDYIDSILPIFVSEVAGHFGYCGVINSDAYKLVTSYRSGAVIIELDSGVVEVVYMKRGLSKQIAFELIGTSTAEEMKNGLKHCIDVIDSHVKHVDSLPLESVIKMSFKHPKSVFNALFLNRWLFLLETDYEMSEDVSMIYDRSVELGYIKE